MSTIPRNLEEVLKLSGRLCTGALISSLTNTPKLTLRKQPAVVLSLMISIPMEYIGMTRWSTLTLTTIQIKFCRWITPLRAIGINLELPIGLILGSTPRTRMLHLTDLSTWFWIWLLEGLLDISRMELLVSLGPIPHQGLLLSSTTIRGSGGQLGENTVPSRSTASKCGTTHPTPPRKNPNPLGRTTWRPPRKSD